MTCSGERTGGATGPQNRNTKLNPRLFQMNDVQKKMAPDHDQTFSVPFPDYILNSPPLQAMVQTAQNAAECYGLTRAELDAFSAESHRKAAAATAAGIYKDEIIALEVEEPVFDEKGEWNENETGKKVLFDRDECIRADTTAEKLAALDDYERSPLYSERERAALRYAEAATDSARRVDDACFARLRARFDEQAILELTALAAFQNLSSKFNAALGVPAQGLCALPVRRD